GSGEARPDLHRHCDRDASQISDHPNCGVDKRPSRFWLRDQPGAPRWQHHGSDLQWGHGDLGYAYPTPEGNRPGAVEVRLSRSTRAGRRTRRSGSARGGPPIVDGSLQEAEYRRAFAAMSQDRLDGLIVGNAEENFTNRRVIL